MKIRVWLDGYRWRYRFSVVVLGMTLIIKDGPCDNLLTHYSGAPRYNNSEHGARQMAQDHSNAIAAGWRQGHLWITRWPCRHDYFGRDVMAVCECGRWVKHNSATGAEWLACGSCRYVGRKDDRPGPRPVTTKKVAFAVAMISRDPACSVADVQRAVADAFGTGVARRTLLPALREARVQWARKKSVAATVARVAASQDPDLDRAVNRFTKQLAREFPHAALSKDNAVRVLLHRGLRADKLVRSATSNRKGGRQCR
jgi:hypothetical protein